MELSALFVYPRLKWTMVRREEWFKAPPVVKRIGCNAIMEIVEKHLSPLLIENTAASIEGRGPHGLFHKMQEVRAENPDLIYYYQSDYKGYYDHILHDKMIDIIKQYIADPILLPILITRVRDNILKSKEQKNIQPTKGGHKMVTCQNYVSLFYRQITSCPSDGESHSQS